VVNVQDLTMVLFTVNLMASLPAVPSALTVIAVAEAGEAIRHDTSNITMIVVNKEVNLFIFVLFFFPTLS
jgi:hypothetical protein